MSHERLTAALADRYRLERELGQGGMATVYLAEDLRHQRKVAIKVLRPELAAVLGAERFVQEITTTAQLQHPHILPLFDSGTADSFLYYVMPYVEGETLRAKLDREKQLGVEEAVRITREVADALDYAHRQGIIHRDIKPENILLHDGRPIVADFGIALAVSAAAGGRMTETGLSLGTPHYMSPEQATAEKEITARSDVYSLASVLYEMLAGQPPHLGGSAQQIIMKIIAEPVAPVTALRKSVPPNVAAALVQALEKLPADRFDGAKSFADALANPAFTSATAAATRLRPTVPLSRRPAVLITALALTAAFAAWGWLRPAPSEPPSAWRTTLALPDTIGLYEGIDISRDGSVVVFGQLLDSRNPIMVRRAGAAGFVPIPGTAGAWPALSPDGHQVAFLSAPGLRVTSIDGGTSTLLTDSTDMSSPIVWQGTDHVIFSRSEGLFRVATAGGALEVVTTVDAAAGEAFHLNPDVLPGGGVAFVILSAASREPAASRIAVVGPGAHHHVVLMPGLGVRYAPPDHLLISRSDGSIVAVPFNPRTLRVTGPPVPVLGGMRIGVFSTVGQFSVSSDGRLVVVTLGGVAAGLSEPVRVTRGGAVAPVASDWVDAFQAIALSPDGRRIAVGLYTASSEEVEVRDLTSGAVHRILVQGAQIRNPTFSPDGGWLLVAVLGPPHTGVYRVPLRTAGSPERWIRFDEVAGVATYPGGLALAPDGRTLYYTKSRGASADIRSRPVGDSVGEEQVVVSASARSPAVSPDGRWLAYWSSESGSGEISVRSTDPARSDRWSVSRGVTLKSNQARWSRDGHEVLFMGTDSVWAVTVTSGAAFTVGARRGLVASGPFASSFGVYPNGDLLMLRSRPGGGATELTMIEDWRAALGQRRE